MTRAEHKARRRELEDSLARVDAALPRRLDDWDRPTNPTAAVRVEVRADVLAESA
jgi:hypothetical protein